MINLLLIILILNSIYWFRRKPKALYCGLWCYSGTEPADGMKMRILAMYNQARGDHATGMCIDDEIVKDKISAKEFLVKYKAMFDFETLSRKNFTVLGHCRQATAQYSKDNINFAHPHGFKKTPEDRRPFLFMVHNGTVTNIHDLCHKYEIEQDFRESSDSMHLGQILTKNWPAKNMDILQDYEGSATIVFYPISAKNTIYVHRDAARDLFYWNETPTKVYISSIKEALMAIGADEPKEFPVGMLIKFTNGQITKEWDLTAKHPYSKPRAKISSVVPNLARSLRGSTSDNKSKDGFYWLSHLIYFNGHAYIGDIYVEKAGRRVERDIMGADKDKFEKYYVLKGVVMKDKPAYEAVFKRCSDSGGRNFKPEVFDKIDPSDLCQYSLYPIMGKSYPGGKDIVWSPKLFSLQAPTDTYHWKPILSDTQFICNRAGIINSTVRFVPPREEVASEMTTGEYIRYLIERKLAQNKHYSSAHELFHDYVTARRVETQENTYDTYINKLVDVLKDYGHIHQSDINEIERAQVVEDYESTVGESHNLAQLVSVALLETCKIELNKRTTRDEEIDLIEQMNHLNDQDNAWFYSEEFKTALLFTAFEGLDDVARAYGASEEKSYCKDFLMAVNNILREIDVITSEEWEENTNAIGRGLVVTVQERLNKAYSMLITETFYNELLNSFIGLETNVEKNIADLCKSILVLKSLISPTTDEEVRLKVYRLALNYISNNSRHINKIKLANQYRITTEEMEALCHS